MDTEERFLKNLTQLNFVLAILIVMHHSFNVNIHYENYDALDVTYLIERYFYNVSEYAVPFFFFISAFLFYRTFDGSFEGYKNKLKRRFYSLVLPYVFYNSLGYVKHVLYTNEKFSCSGFVDALLLSTTMPLWFIRELIIFSILSLFLFYVIKYVKAAVIIIFISALLSILGVVEYRSFVYWMPVYLMGGIYSKIIVSSYHRIIVSSYHRIIVSSFVILLIIIPWFLPNNQYDLLNFNQKMFYYAFRIICIPMIIYVYMNISFFKEKWYMRYSFFIYCVHFVIISLCKAVFINLRLYYMLLQYFFTIFFTVLISIYMARFFSIRYPIIWRLLNGWRK
ncbi:hypothetical protein SELR_17270 [Selenomonas ruminantium subsp. lactilytica TAM6421]|uniref:Acyltransferase 3 domain-containing protein n=1 Tax=Selenomonas ruminantium subsp. lactilytica (strain NBRC 103574 / TAM6421) TaxID=927704 RepID=I0GRP8_SELRL|nr:hypothetical protein SELR_17270 [Selenomonas ruminantium subsp. lactilytica TAM6421]